MAIAGWVASARVRRVAIALAVAGVVLAVRWQWSQLTGSRVPYSDYDSAIYVQIAEQPLGLGLVTAPKPLVVPLLYRLAGNDASTIVAWQTELAFVAWAILTAGLVCVLRRGWTRLLAIGLGVVFLLAPARVGYTGSLLSESFNDSLTALVVAGVFAAVRLRGRLRVAAAVAAGVLGLLWMLTRDSNVPTALAAVAIAMVVWRGWRLRWAWAAAAGALAISVLVAWSTGQAHAPLAYQRTWEPRFTPRTMYPMIDNVIMRAYPDLLAALPPELRMAAEPQPEVWRLVEATPEGGPLRDWLVDHGSSLYAHWLIGHPLARAGELVGARWTALAGPQSRYMPAGRSGRVSLLRRVTAIHAILLAMILAAPILLWRPRGQVITGIAFCLIGSGVVGVVVSYYGDAAEISRHCYGASQQVVLGLFVALLAWLDRLARATAPAVS